MKAKNMLIGLGIFIILGMVIYGYIWWKSLPGKYDNFAKCLNEKGAIMYGTDWCSYCKNQKNLFGRSFEFVNYVNCDYEKDECQDQGVKGYPTWKINEKIYPGVQSIGRLSSLTGCEL
jgi:glutaredoxin